MIKKGKVGWESMVPTYVDNIIKENELFGYAQKKKKRLTKATKK